MRKIIGVVLILSVSFPSGSLLKGQSQEVPGGSNSTSEEPKASDWEYLFPDGDGRDYVVSLCQGCHSLKTPALQRNDESGWRSIILQMNDNGMLGLAQDEVDLMAKYLAQHFGAKQPTLEIPLDLSTASPEQLSRFPALTKEDVVQIVSTRKKNAIKTLVDLKQMLSDEKIRKIEPFVSQR